MIKEHPLFQNPTDPYLKLWRYIDFTRFFSLLDKRSLFFCRSDKLKMYDPFEGSLPARDYAFLLRVIKDINIDDWLTKISTETHVSCWHLAETESVAMWKIYAPSGNGVAIQSTVPRFKSSFVDFNGNIYCGIVRYIDFENDLIFGYDHTDPSRIYVRSDFNRFGGIVIDYPPNNFRLNGFLPFIHKRKIFDYEREYRAICWEKENSYEHGHYIPIHLEKLIERVIVSPNSPNWFVELISNTLLSKNLDSIKVQKSIFEEKPWPRKI